MPTTTDWLAGWVVMRGAVGIAVGIGVDVGVSVSGGIPSPPPPPPPQAVIAIPITHAAEAANSFSFFTFSPNKKECCTTVVCIAFIKFHGQNETTKDGANSMEKMDFN
ncbi:MAG: hypothetical protein ORN29_03990 [Rhodoferax sp.]|nr:hypothetical protein [Rhodoferax sp.]